MSHGCTGCTRVKRYHSDLIGEGVVLGSNTEVANTSGAEAAGDQIQTDLGDLAPLPANLPDSLPQLEAPPVGSPRGYIRMAVMDGKGIKHRINARPHFTIIRMADFARPIYSLPTHAGSSRVDSLYDTPELLPVAHSPTLTGTNSMKIASDTYLSLAYSELFIGSKKLARALFRLPRALHFGCNSKPWGNTPGGDVIHPFKAKSIYCLQTLESAPQVLRFLNNTWANYPNSRLSFLAYDNACNLLRHIVTQDPSDIWLATTKFIVDAWHYIRHQATDILCRTRCNPAPTDGSQPDLVLTEVDDNGQVHQTRAFNTETAEQLNSWLNGFESQLRQMSDVNYDFFIHVLMLIYAETMEKRIQLKEMELTEEFWDRVNGLA
ncbi:hypothetical protein MVEN_02562700 [Mycena venus]|uniref:Uncharacterized protein n=1 Tax=Mycena venus TaxID=2733690 RepID=A0A8H6WRH4_9AGAR|nr:hypothetical protein MVEN_02562700 [Mycena venus]